MGDCTSRPSREKISIHMKEGNNRNDIKFFEKPDVLVLRSTPPVPENLSERVEFYEDCLGKLKADTLCLLKAAEKYSLKYKIPPYPYIVAEVQKGVDIISTELCLQGCQPYVVVSLEPKGSRFSTFPGEIDLPVWFQLFEFQLGTYRYEKLVFTVFLTRRLGSPSEVGKVEFSLKELKSQELRHGWHELALKYPIQKAIPRLKLRVQMVIDLPKLVESLKKTTEDALTKTTQTISDFTLKLSEAEFEHQRHSVGLLRSAKDSAEAPV